MSGFSADGHTDRLGGGEKAAEQANKIQIQEEKMLTGVRNDVKKRIRSTTNIHPEFGLLRVELQNIPSLPNQPGHNISS